MTPDAAEHQDASTTWAASERRRTPAGWLRDRLLYAFKLVRAFDPLHPVDSARMVRAFRHVAKAKATGVDVFRLQTLWRLSRRIDAHGIDGDIVECGVWNGGTAAVMALANRRQDRRFWLFDSFAGFPKPGEKDVPGAVGIQEGDWKGSLARVRGLFARLGIPDSRIEIVPGWFQQTLPSSPVRRIALLHLDADLYDSVRLGLECFYDRISPGGYVVLDDYGFWPGCRTAVDEFLKARGLRVTLHVSDETGRWFQKPVDDRG
jgi:O-methyltransferase